MSSKLHGMVWELVLTHAEQSIMLALTDHAHDDGTHCYPGVAYLAWKTDYSERQVQRILASLVASGLLEPVRYVAGGRGHATEFIIHLHNGVKKQPFEKGDKMSPFSQERVTFGAQRVTFGDGKGDISARKGDIAMSPQPLEPKEEPKEPIDNAERVRPSPAQARAREFSPTSPVLSDDLLEQAAARLETDEATVLSLAPKWATKRKARGKPVADQFEDFIGFGMSYLDIERGRQAPNGARASPGASGGGRIAQNLANLREIGAGDGYDGIFSGHGGAGAELPAGTVEGTGRALPPRAGRP